MAKIASVFTSVRGDGSPDISVSAAAAAVTTTGQQTVNKDFVRVFILCWGCLPNSASNTLYGCSARGAQGSVTPVIVGTGTNFQIESGSNNNEDVLYAGVDTCNNVAFYTASTFFAPDGAGGSVTVPNFAALALIFI